jgi:class 3 adenylate cyclase
MPASERRLLTVLFTDIVGSTGLAVEMGDARWRETIARHHRIVRRELKRFGGREIDTAGDGFFATFDRPARAIRCAAAALEAVRELGIEIRAGLHLGEVEVAGKKVGGVAVHTGARVMAAAAPGEVLVTDTLRQLVSGAGLGFTDRGLHTLKGVPGEWRLHALATVDDRSVDPALDPPTAVERREAITTPTLLRRGKTPLVVVALSMLVVAVSIVLAGRSPPAAHGPTDPPLGSVLQVNVGDESGGSRVLRTVPDALEGHGGGNPKLAVGEGGVWVRSAFLEHLDPQTGAVVGDHLTIETTGDFRADRGIEVGLRAVWIGGGETGGNARLLSWDPATDDPLPEIRLRSNIVITDVALGFGAVWVTFPDGRLVKIDPGTREPVDETHLDGSLDGVVVGAGGVWTLDVTEGTLIKVDPGTLAKADRVQVTGSILDMAADEERIWLLEAGGDVVIPIDADGTLRQQIPIGEDPSGIAVGLDAVWVSDESGEVYRIDRVTQETTTLHVRGHLTAIAVDEETGTLWVTVGGDRP